jgi:LPXTG-site transpeptidase (sortase) family protein
MWQRMTQRIRVVRRRRLSAIAQQSLQQSRRNTQRLTRLVSTPLIIISAVVFLYLALQSLTIYWQQYSRSNTRISNQTTPTSAATAEPVVAMAIQATVTPFATVIPATVIPATATPVPVPFSIESLRIPVIELDSPVIEVGWDEVINTQGQPELVWQVAEYAVGHHLTSAYPGQPSNIVLSAHVGGYGKLFRRLNEIAPGDVIYVRSNGREFAYAAQEQILVDERNPSQVEQITNVSYINQTSFEVLTLITCWPPTGPDRFTQRLIVRAVPLSGE